jgi:predicted RNA methylase
MAHEVVWDDESWDVLSCLLVELARGSGRLPIGLLLRPANRLFAGEFDVKQAEVERSRAPAGPIQIATFDC